jgi:hypothetical protein
LPATVVRVRQPIISALYSGQTGMGPSNPRACNIMSELPSEIDVGLGPQQIARILGESLRQHFVQSGAPDTVAGLQAK